MWKNMELLIFNFKHFSACCNGWLAISNVPNQHAHDIVLLLSKDLKINFIFRINTKFRMSFTVISNTICAYHSGQVDSSVRGL